jgi:hypothetical protein
MRIRINRLSLIVLSLALCAAVCPAYGQALSPEQRQALLGYQLTLPGAEHLIGAMQAMTKYLISLPDYQERLRKAATMSAADRIAQLERDPKASAIVKENSLTARDYLIGVPALRMALMAAQGIAGPNIVASPANTAFAKANLAQLKPKMDAADGVRR